MSLNLKNAAIKSITGWPKDKAVKALEQGEWYLGGEYFCPQTGLG